MFGRMNEPPINKSSEGFQGRWDMPADSIRVLIVDDSVFMRSMLKSVRSETDGIEVIGTAQNGIDGLRKIDQLKPDVVTLDIEMPGLTGLEVLQRVMKEDPLPVVMVSTKTQRGAEATLDALHLGPVECVAKLLGEKSASLESFRSKVALAVQTQALALRRKPLVIKMLRTQFATPCEEIRPNVQIP